MRVCPICDGEIKREEKKVTYRYKEHTRDIVQSGEYCTQCHEGFLSLKDLKISQKRYKSSLYQILLIFQSKLSNLLLKINLHNSIITQRELLQVSFKYLFFIKIKNFNFIIILRYINFTQIIQHIIICIIIW